MEGLGRMGIVDLHMRGDEMDKGITKNTKEIIIR